MSTNVDENRDRIESILERCLGEVRDEGRSIEDCLEHYPEQRAELEPLLRLAVRLRSGQEVKTNPHYKNAVETRLRRKAAASRRSAPAWPRPRAALAWALLLVVVLIALGAGAAAASAQALPGDLFYPVKRAGEQVQLSLTTRPIDQAGLHLEFANRRLAEAVSLAEKQRTEALEPVLADYSKHIQEELALLTQVDGLSPEQQLNLAGQLISSTSRNEKELTALSKEAAQPVQTSLQAALATTQRAQNQAQEIVRALGPAIQPTPMRQDGRSSSPTPTPKTDLATRSTPTPGAPLKPTATPAPGTQTGRTATEAIATPLPAATRTAVNSTPGGSSETKPATSTPARSTPTPLLQPALTNTPGNAGTPSTGAGPGPSATPGR